MLQVKYEILKNQYRYTIDTKLLAFEYRVIEIQDARCQDVKGTVIFKILPNPAINVCIHYTYTV